MNRYVLLLLLLVIFGAGVVHAQRQPERQNIQGKGELKAIRPGFLLVASEKNDQWVLKLPDKPNAIVVQGSAEPSWLQPGMMVRFVAVFDGKGQPQEVVRELQVFVPGEGDEIGVFRDSNFGANIFSSEADQAAKKTNKNSEPESAPYRVAGRLAGFKGEKMQILAGRTPVQVELAEDAKISFEVNDYRLAQIGDSVEFQGWYFAVQPGNVATNRVTIVAKEVRVGVTKKKNVRAEQGKQKDKEGDKEDEKDKEDVEKKDKEKDKGKEGGKDKDR